MVYAAKLKPGALYQTVVNDLCLCYLDLGDPLRFLGHEDSSFHNKDEYFLFVESCSGKQLEKRLGKKFDTSLGRRCDFHHFIGRDRDYWFTEWSIKRLRVVWMKRNIDLVV